jgi:aspartate kinase
MERQTITGIAYDKNEARLTLAGAPAGAGAVAAVLGALAEAGINSDMIIQSGGDLTFTLPATSLAHAAHLIEQRKAEIGFESLATDTAICKVSIVGVGIRSNPDIAARMFRTLADRKIDIFAIATSEIKISVLIPEDYTELAVRVLHTAFELDAEA